MHSKLLAIIVVALTGFVLVGAITLLPALASPPAAPANNADIVHVDDDTCPQVGSGTDVDPYCRIQDAVDTVAEGGEVRVATGTYTGTELVVDNRTGYTYTQVVFITKSLTLRGGYTSSDWNASINPTSNTTIIDAERRGRGISIVGWGGDAPAVMLDGLTLTGGDYTGLGNPAGTNIVCGRTGYDCGGGLFATQTSLVVRNTVVSDNIASRADSGRASDGGGIYLWNLQPGSTVSGSVIISNSVSGSRGGGGGIGSMYGSGLTITGSLIEGNFAPGSGGGVKFFQPRGEVAIEATDLVYNEASDGGALEARLTYSGEALRMEQLSMLGNEATDRGAAIYVYKQSSGRSTVQMTNLVLASNRCSSSGAQSAIVDLIGGTNNELAVALAHVTAADNRAPSFLYAQLSSAQGQVTATLTNTLVVSFTNAFVGASTGGGDLLIRHTNTLTQNVSALHTTLGGGAPVFVAVNPLGGDARLDGTYHLRPGSDAIDAGVDAGVTVDIDGDTRPYHDGFDIGADEFTTYRVYLPLVSRVVP